MAIVFHRTDINPIKFIHKNVSGSSVVVLPTKRAIREFVDLWQKTSEAPILFTYEEFFNSLIDTRYILPDRFTKNLLLREAVRSVGDSKRIMKDDFEYLKDITMLEGFIDDLGGFYREIVSSGVGFGRLKQFSAYTEYFDHISILEEIFDKYMELLHKNGFEDIDMLKTGKIEKTSKYGEIYLAVSGFFTYFEQEAIKTLSETCRVHIVIEDAEIPEKMKAILRRLEPKISLASSRLHRNIILRRFSTKSAMAADIVRLVRYEYYHNNIRLEKIKVVLPDESIADLLRTFDRELFNFANGFKLSESIYYKYLKAASDLNDNMYSGLYRCNYLIKLLNHPFLNKAEAKALLNRIYKSGLPTIELSATDLKAILMTDFNKIYYTKSISLQETSSRLLELMKQFSKEYEKSNMPADYIQASQTFFEELERISMLNKDFVKLGSTGAVMIRYLLGRISEMRYPDAGIGKVKVMGMLESRLLEQDVAIIPSLNDGILPKATKKELFLNSIIREECGLPTRIDREELQQYYFRSIIRSSKTVYLSYIEDDQSQISKFLSDIMREYNLKAEAAEVMLGYMTGNQPTRFGKPEEPLDSIEKDDWMIEKLKNKRFSASAIDLYKDCPYKFYLKYVKDIEAKISFEKFPFELGRFVHNLLAGIYENQKPINDEKLLRKRFGKLFGSIKKSNGIFAYDSTYKIKADYFLYRIENSDFFRNEASCKAEQIITESEFDVFIDCEIGKINFGGRIDRINLYKDEFEIIDYKTGSSGINRFSMGKNYSVQLPLYGYAVQNRYKRRCRGLYYYDLSEFKRIDFAEETFPEKIIEAVIEKIRLIIGEIFNMSLPFAKTNRHCAFCEYRRICRKDEN